MLIFQRLHFYVNGHYSLRLLPTKKLSERERQTERQREREREGRVGCPNFLPINGLHQNFFLARNFGSIAATDVAAVTVFATVKIVVAVAVSIFCCCLDLRLMSSSLWPTLGRLHWMLTRKMFFHSIASVNKSLTNAIRATFTSLV